MKNFFAGLILLGGLVLVPQETNAQFFKKLVKRVDSKIKSEAESRTNKRADKAVDKGFDKAEDAIDGKNQTSSSSKNDSNNSNNNSNNGNSNTNSNSSNQGNQNDVAANGQNANASKAPTVTWSRFDFIPGETVIFEDGPASDEENGEFPSRWDLQKGNIEIVDFDGEKTIMCLEKGTIVPYLKNSNEDYLPEIFTVEFDVYFAKGTKDHRYYLNLFDKKNQRQGKLYKAEAEIFANGIEVGNSNARYPGREKLNWSNEPEGRWAHISVAYTKGKYKVYMDDTRLINIPRLEDNPSGISITMNNDNMYVKNIRIAKGGVKYYDRVLSDGKIVVNGIKFDVNKATLKAESMGPINEIYELMNKNSDIKFSVEGHTDSDGDDNFNMDLSKKRGEAVMNKLIEMGISSDRLKFTGYGESKPLDNNSTAEGKANNRRVEFVKF